MARATVHSLGDKDRALVAQTRLEHLRTLDEDALVELHDRVRRARNKHVQLHRRRVAERVEVIGARGTASLAPRHSASKAEIFEDALARVSSSLAKAARQSARELRAERLAAAQTAPVAARPDRSPRADDRAPANDRVASRRPIERTANPSTRATGARRQAKRDAR